MLNNPEYLPCTINEIQGRVDEIAKSFNQANAFLKIIITALKSDNFTEVITVEEMASLMFLFQSTVMSIEFDLRTLKANIDYLALPVNERNKLKHAFLLECR